MRRLPPGRQPSGRLPHRLRLLSAALVAAALALVPATAYADPSTTPSPSTGGQSSASNVGPATAGTAVCTLTSSTLTQISGLAVTANAIMVVESKHTDG